MAVINDSPGPPIKGDPLSHDNLVKRAGKWLLTTYISRYKCPIVLTELVTANGEIPDAIGYNQMITILIECKASRADFLQDKKKAIRHSGGMGDYRFFMAPKGMLNPDELPHNWGLLEATQHQIKVTKEPKPIEDADKQAEIRMLISVIRRLKMSTAVFIETDHKENIEHGG